MIHTPDFNLRVTTEFQDNAGGSYDVLLRQGVELTSYGPRVIYHRVLTEGDAEIANEIAINWLDDLFRGRINRAYHQGAVETSHVFHPHDETIQGIRYPILIICPHRQQSDNYFHYGFEADAFVEVTK